jgi:hypothetical protein
LGAGFVVFNQYKSIVVSTQTFASRRRTSLQAYAGDQVPAQLAHPYLDEKMSETFRSTASFGGVLLHKILWHQSMSSALE